MHKSVSAHKYGGVGFSKSKHLPRLTSNSSVNISSLPACTWYGCISNRRTLPLEFKNSLYIVRLKLTVDCDAHYRVILF